MGDNGANAFFSGGGNDYFAGSSLRTSSRSMRGIDGRDRNPLRQRGECDP